MNGIPSARTSRIAIAVMGMAMSVAALGCQQADAQSRESRAVDIIQEAYEDGELHGAAAIIGAGTGPQYAAGGRTTEPGGAAIDSQTRFRIASLTKVVTQAAILRLVDEGRIELDASIAKYRPGLDAEWADTVTIRQLLVFRSGLPRERSADDPIGAGVEYDHNGSALALLDSLVDVGPIVEPGTQTRYSNYGYMQLGGVIEAVTGMALEQAFETLVFEPAGMTETHLHGADVLDGETYANGHRRNADGAYAVIDQFPVSVRYTAGGLSSSVGDLAKLSRAIFEGKLLSNTSTRLLLTGFGDRKQPRLRAAGHVPGFANYWTISLDPPFGVVLLNNSVSASPQAVIDVGDQVVAALTGERAKKKDRKPIEEEGWRRFADIREIPDHSVRSSALAYIEALLAEDTELMFERNMAMRCMSLEDMSEKDAEGFRKLAQYELGAYVEFGPFKPAAWRPGERDRLEIYLEGEDGRAIFYRFAPNPKKPGCVSSVSHGTIGFTPTPVDTGMEIIRK